MADLALESFSISVPLIEFHDAASQCTDGSVDVSVEIGEDEGPVVEGHPYVVTRFDLFALPSVSFNVTYHTGLNYASSAKITYSTPRRIMRCATRLNSTL